jgi:CRP/FNR family transcriptional regulator, cyclic AMP receptor protein
MSRKSKIFLTKSVPRLTVGVMYSTQTPAVDADLFLSGRLAGHAQCIAVSDLFRGKLCQELGRRPSRRLKSGEFLYHMGEPAKSVYLMRSGLIKTSLVTPGGHQLTLRIHKTGDILGELCLCAGERREQAVALEESDVVEIPLDLLLARLRRDPSAALEFARAASARLLDSYQRLESLSAEPAMGRLTRTLLDLALDLGEPAAHGEIEIRHHITQEELGRLISARREVVSSLLNELRKTGLISYTRRGFIVVRRDALQSLLESITQA